MSLNEVKNLIRSKKIAPKNTENVLLYIERHGHFIRDRREEFTAVGNKIDTLQASKKDKEWFDGLLKDWGAKEREKFAVTND
jgi:hypothetical protein